jgi:beta-lactamase regulating signal transducer with metallopeptidase domain/tetratricopeptide (TPR) repeat protein
MNATVAFGIRFALDVAVKATFLFAVTGIALFALRRAPAAARHLVATVGLAAALALPVLTQMLPRVSLPLLPGLPAAARAGEAMPALAVDSSPDADMAPLRDSVVLEARTADERSASARVGLPGAIPAPSPARRIPWLALALAVWAAGALLLGARLAVGWARVRRIAREAEPLADADWSLERDALSRRLGVRRRVELLESAAVPVAMTSGFFRPLLLLGRAARLWAVERRRIVLLHELAHVKRGDWLALLVAEAALALYWFHPAAWLLARQIRNDGELASDDLVLASGTKPSVYAGHLLGIFRSLSTAAHPVAPALAIARPSHFEERLRAILDPAAPRRDVPRGRVILSAAGVLAAAALVAVVEPWAPARAGAAILRPDSDLTISMVRSLAPGKASTEACPTARARARTKASGPVRTSASASPSPSAHESPAPPSEPLPESGRSLPAVLKLMPGVVREAAAGFVRASNGGERSDRKSGSDWYSRGLDLHHDERYDQAIAAFQKAIDAGYREGAASYNIACGYALKGNRDKAFEWLHRAMDAGFDVSSYLGRDDDLDNLRSDPRWKELKKAAREHKSTREEDKTRAVTARFERLSANPPKSGERFFEIGKELLNADRYDLSAKAFQAAADRGYRVGTSLYNEACALSRGGDTRAALDLLQKALDAGFDQPDLFRKDDDLDNVRDDKRFAEIEREARELSLPGWTDQWTFGSSRRRSKWRETAKKLEDYARAHPQKGRAWFNLGYASLAGDRPEGAVEAFQKAFDLNYRKPTSMYNLACSYARLDQKDKAFEWLFKALDAGFDGIGTLRSDDDLDNLRGDPRYRKAIEIGRAREKAEED